MNSMPKIGDMQSKTKPKLNCPPGLPPLLSPRTKLDPPKVAQVLQTFRSLSTFKKQSTEKKEANRPVTDNTNIQKAYQSQKQHKNQRMIIRTQQNRQTQQIPINTAPQEQILCKFYSPAVRVLEFPLNDLQEDILQKEEGHPQLEQIMENILQTNQNQSSEIQSVLIDSQSSNKFTQNDSLNSQFNFDETPTFTEGDMIGVGSYGKVFRTQENKTGKIYAVKKINTYVSNFDQTDLKDLKDEIDLLKRIKHKNIIRYVWNNKGDDYWSIYLEYMSQGTLTQLTEKFGPLNLITIRFYSKQILSALDYLHENDIIHRDIKGANLLIGVDGTIKLGDFGCSKIKEKTIQKSRHSDACLMSTLKGTILYMAPEVASQEVTSKAGDIWSFGCTVLEMAQGKKPWSEHNFDNPIQALLKIIEDDALPNIPQDLDPQLDDFIRICLQRDYKLRPTAQDLLKHQFITKK